MSSRLTRLHTLLFADALTQSETVVAALQALSGLMLSELPRTDRTRIELLGLRASRIASGHGWVFCDIPLRSHKPLARSQPAKSLVRAASPIQCNAFSARC